MLIMAWQMRLLMSTSEIDKIIDNKLNRQIERIRKEKEYEVHDTRTERYE